MIRSWSLDKFRYNLPYPGMTGGVLAISALHFSRLNGFSNTFYGWGGEDDDLFQRMVSAGLEVTRLRGERSRYISLYHPVNVPSESRYRSRVDMSEDGLDSLRYTRLRYKHHACFAHLLVRL